MKRTTKRTAPATATQPAVADAPQPEAKQTGRPSSYSEEIANQIVARLAEGEPLRQICRTEGFPAWRTVYDWMNRNEALSTAIARARDLGFDAIAEGTLEVASGGEGSTGDVVRDKLIVETRLKLLAKWNPKKYGDSSRVEMDVKGDVSDPLIAARQRLVSIKRPDAA